MRTYIINVLINLVGENINIFVLENNLCQRSQFLLRIHTTRRIARGTKYQHLGLGGDGRFQLFGRHLEILLKARIDNHRFSTRQFHHLGVTYPIWRGDNNLFTIIDQGHDSIANTLLGTIAHQYLIDAILQTVLPLQLRGNRLTQVSVTGHRRVAGIVVIHGLFGCLLDVFWCVEIGFSHTHVDNIDTLRFHLRALLRHRKSGRWGKSLQTIR